MEPNEAFAAVRGGAEWVVHRCGGSATWSRDVEDAGEVLDPLGSWMVGNARNERLTSKAKRSGGAKTVVIAESWVDKNGKRLIVFLEGPPGVRSADVATPDHS